VDGITELWVSGMKATVAGDKITRYRVTANITFLVQPHK
jgi:hypothetical protein